MTSNVSTEFGPNDGSRSSCACNTRSSQITRQIICESVDGFVIHCAPCGLWSSCWRFCCSRLSVIRFDRADAQATRPTLISHADSTRAIAFESVTRQREPFTTTVQVKFGSDSATRIMLFAMNLQLQPGETASAVTADAEDATSHDLSADCRTRRHRSGSAVGHID